MTWCGTGTRRGIGKCWSRKAGQLGHRSQTRGKKKRVLEANQRRHEKEAWVVEMARPMSAAKDMLAPCDGQSGPAQEAPGTAHLLQKWESHWNGKQYEDGASQCSKGGRTPRHRQLWRHPVGDIVSGGCRTCRRKRGVPRSVQAISGRVPLGGKTRGDSKTLPGPQPESGHAPCQEEWVGHVEDSRASVASMCRCTWSAPHSGHEGG